MIKGQEIFKYIDPRAKYISKDDNGLVRWWSAEPVPSTNVWGRDGVFYSGILGRIDIEEFQGKDSKECILAKETDPKEWIGCLCLFWDGDEEIERLGILESISEDDAPYLYQMKGSSHLWCQPVKKSEVKFFEDK